VDLAIVVVSYNTSLLTRACLQSVYRALEDEHLSAHVRVVDNASVDGSADMIREEFPQVTLTALAENHGFARGTNLALSSIDAERDPPRHVLLLNPDTLVKPGALSQMLALLDAKPTAGAVGAQLEYGDGTFQHGAFRFPTLWMTFFDFWTINHRLINSRLNGRYPQRLYRAGVPFAIDHPLGAAMMIRWETLGRVGTLDEGYYMYCEEIDWCIRARRAGWGVYCVPQAHIVHLAGQSTSQFREQMFVALWRSRYRLFDRYYGRAHNWAVRMIVRAGLAKRAQQTRIALSEQRIGLDVAERQMAAYRAVLEM
jgi:N-acetylglucosaminyl-diphospho-decaprenol L-rhamnosyltransferase